MREDHSRRGLCGTYPEGVTRGHQVWWRHRAQALRRCSACMPWF